MMALRDEMRATYDRARQQGMDEGIALTLVFNRHLRGTLAARVKAAGPEPISAVLDALDTEYRAFAGGVELPGDFFHDALRDNYPDVFKLWRADDEH